MDTDVDYNCSLRLKFLKFKAFLLTFKLALFDDFFIFYVNFENFQIGK